MASLIPRALKAARRTLRGERKCPWMERAERSRGLQFQCWVSVQLCFAILKSYDKSFRSQAFGNETRKSTEVSWHRCVLVGVVQECGLLRLTAWFPPQLHHLPRKARWVTDSHSACFLKSKVGLIIVLINLSTKCPVHVKYLSQYLARGKSPLSPHVVITVTPLRQRWGHSRWPSERNGLVLGLGSPGSARDAALWERCFPIAEGGRVAWSGLSSPPALWYTWIRHFMLGTQLFQWTFQRQIKGLFVKPFELHWVVLWERFYI